MSPICAKPHDCTVRPRLRRVQIERVFAKPEQTQLEKLLSTNQIARLSLPLTGQRIARRSLNAKYHERRAPVHTVAEIDEQKFRRGAITLGLWLFVFGTLLAALANWGAS